MRVNVRQDQTTQSRVPQCRARRGRRGVTALMAMLFLMLITTLSLAMFHIAANNVQTSANYADLARAHAAAESGLRWTAYRFATMNRPRDLAGTITPNIAFDIWNRSDGLRDRFVANLSLVRDQKGAPLNVVSAGDTVTINSNVPTDLPGATFQVVVRQLSTNDFTGTQRADQRFVRVTATGK